MRMQALFVEKEVEGVLSFWMLEKDDRRGAADGSERVHAEGLGGDYDSGTTMTMEAV